ncbi:TonB-dependent receptor [Paucibacter sp. APW11]|uniref:TonB-dependent receptor n=1 Tax=Roseateles aquae TaxID=3077235 RepID=A0ABU3PC15_9BURK|nr:TonB-dependent receptor [Paucibacter sp. APW11]MDT9000114.1 TonB-dependent receptor [Paucibacter sp. APW11]
MKLHKQRPHLIALACAGLLPLSPLARAAGAETLERVEVTGSHIKRASDEGSTPVQVLRREDLQRLGANTVQEMLNSLSSATPRSGLSDVDGANSFAGGSSGASQRNLGKQSTLVLLNFRRVAPYPLADFSEVFTNLDALPAEAVERIEILKSGGAAIYGSDAVAGVINIITRQDFQGVAASASRQQGLGAAKFTESRASLSAGTGDLAKQGFNIFAHAELFSRKAETDWRRLLGEVNPRYKEIFPGLGGPATYTDYNAPGNVFPMDGPPHALPGCKTLNPNGLCLKDDLASAELSPAAERANLLLRARYRPTAELDGFTEVLYSRTRNDYQQRPFSIQWPYRWLNPATNTPLTFQPNRGLPAGHPLNPSPFEAQLHYAFDDAPTANQLRSEQYRALTGLQGVWQGMDWEVAVGVTGGKTRLTQQGGFASDSGFKSLIGDYNAFPLAPDYFNKPGGYQLGKANSPDVLARLFPVLGWDGQNRQTFVDGKLSGDLAQWQHGAVSVATGFDLRHESMKIIPTDNIQHGDIIGLGTSVSDGARNAAAIYAELSLPVAAQLTLEAAGRVDKFDGFGAHASPKLGLRYQPSKQWLLRAALETGFRAPNLTESATSTKSAFTPPLRDPRRCDAAQALANDLHAQASALPANDPARAALEGRAGYTVNVECNGFVNMVTLNNPDLKPETSRSVSLGLVFTPDRGWNLALDYYNIERKDEISMRNPNELLAMEAALPSGVVRRDSDPNRDGSFISPQERAKYFDATHPYVGSIQSVTNRFENQFKTRTSGLDLAINAALPTRFGRLGWTLDGSYLLNFQQWLASTGDWSVNMAGRYGYERLKLRNTVSLQHGNFSHALSHVYRSGQSLEANDDDRGYAAADCVARGWPADLCRVGSAQQFDYDIAYTGFKGLRLSAHLFNLFAQRPPLDLRAADQARGGNYPFDRADVRGRMLKLAAEYRF